MKNLLLIILVLGFSISRAQTPVTASVNAAGWKRVAYCNAAAGRGFGKITIYTTGGSATPYQLDIEWFKDWSVSGGLSVKSNSKTAYWTDVRLTYDKDTTYIEVNFTKDFPGLLIVSDNYGWNVAKAFSGFLPNGGGTVRAAARVGKFSIDDYLTVAYNGNVGIGTMMPTTKLAVNGTIRAEEIKVEAGPWPDYVFKENYPLLSLEEIATYIQTYGHLPGVPNAQAVAVNGVSLGEMNRVLLQKIEEMTLLLIEKDKAMKMQDKRIERLEKSLNLN
ncbi:hypothetical protein HP439_12380 [Sphingobacterium shayense]|uniref:hypothetical protein n=1 Tax=Sphingobacterium shayense TaxID=626343 RepID=UPI0015529C6B|nr:hypothetical protein [Sphingobacterium shayense]NQD71521.1 hypothetical protein [Sphingobacterium shayense]